MLSVTGTRALTEHPSAVAKDPQTKQHLADQKRLLTAARRSGNLHDHLPLIVLVALLREEDGGMSVMMSRKCTSAYQPGLGGPLRVRLQGALQGVHDAPAFPRLGASRTAGGPRVASRKLGCKEAARRVAGTPEHAGHDRNTTEGPGRAGSRNTRETSTGTSEPEHHRIRRLTLGGACVDDANVHEDPCVGLGTVAVGGPGAVTALAYDARRRYPRPPPRATARPRSATTTTTL